MDPSRPHMLGIVGDSAAGKTTLTRGVVRLLGHNGVTPICLDDYHRFDRSERLARHLTTVDPAANDLDLMAEHLATLRDGGSVRKPIYDHHTGTRRPSELVAATGLIIAYGLLTLTPAGLASLFDLTVFLDPDEELRHRWRIARDVSERGYTYEQVLAIQEAHDRDAERYVQVQRPHADLVVRFRPASADPADTTSLAADLFCRHTPATTCLRPFFDYLTAANLPGLSLSSAMTDIDGCLADLLTIEAHFDAAMMAAPRAWLWEHMPAATIATPQLIGGLPGGDPPNRSEALALVQLLTAYLLIQR